MALGTTAQGYGSVAKALHWLTVLLVAAQFVVGYTLEWDDDGGGEAATVAMAADDPGDKERKEREKLEKERQKELEKQQKGQQKDAEDQAEGHGEADEADERSGGILLPVHVGLGIGVLVMGIVRVIRRRVDGLPAWAEQLSAGQRRLATWTERSLLTLLFVIPASGLALVLSGDDGLAPLHVGAHIAFFAALAAHVGLAVSKRTLPRML